MQNFYSYWQEFTDNSQKILLLQGPVGPFFLNLKHYLTVKCGKRVFKINFNGGDDYYYPVAEDALNYRGTVAQFEHFLSEFIEKEQIDAVVCFGDNRIYHRIARDYCMTVGCSFWAFEEGYLRPHYITFEKWGVNYSSQIARDATMYDATSSDFVLAGKLNFKRYQPRPVASGFWKRASFASRYYFELWRQEKAFPAYRHHREKRLHIYASAWLKAGFSSFIHGFKDRKIERQIVNKTLAPFFIFPLQVHNDSQIRQHGRGKSVSQHLRSVINSFAEFAPQNTHLVIKHHPMDKGFSDYSCFIKKLAKKRGVYERVHYVFDVPMPIFLRKAKGMVVVNSTTGISALIHNLPVKVIGDAHYDIPGLTSRQSLAQFWQNPESPNHEKVEYYLHYLRAMTQLNGSFYHRTLTIAEFNTI